MSDIERYKHILNELAERGSTEFINNSSMNHAAAMIETLFNHGVGKVRLLTDHLTCAVYDRQEIKEAIINFLQEPDNAIDVTMQFNEESEETALKNHSFLAFLSTYKDKVKLFRATNTLKSFSNHFMVVKTKKGHYAFRFETDIKERFATGCFNSEENGKILCEYFDEHIRKGIAVPIKNWCN